METKNYFGEYLAPEVEVIEMEGQGVLCASGNTLDDFPKNNWGDN